MIDDSAPSGTWATSLNRFTWCSLGVWTLYCICAARFTFKAMITSHNEDSNVISVCQRRNQRSFLVRWRSSVTAHMPYAISLATISSLAEVLQPWVHEHCLWTFLQDLWVSPTALLKHFLKQLLRFLSDVGLSSFSFLLSS